MLPEDLPDNVIPFRPRQARGGKQAADDRDTDAGGRAAQDHPIAGRIGRKIADPSPMLGHVPRELIPTRTGPSVPASSAFGRSDTFRPFEVNLSLMRTGRRPPSNQLSNQSGNQSSNQQTADRGAG